MDQRATRVAQDAPASPLATAPRSGPLVWWAACSFAAILGFSRLSYGLLFPAVQRDLGGTYGVYGTLATLNFGPDTADERYRPSDTLLSR